MMLAGLIRRYVLNTSRIKIRPLGPAILLIALITA
jgi:hypothetical protein